MRIPVTVMIIAIAMLDQPTRLWASTNERKTVRAGCGRWRSQFDPIDATGRRSAGRHAQ